MISRSSASESIVRTTRIASRTDQTSPGAERKPAARVVEYDRLETVHLVRAEEPIPAPAEVKFVERLGLQRFTVAAAATEL
jgi:hypothetical protein